MSFKVESMNPDNITTISQDDVLTLNSRLSELNYNDKITLICTGLGGTYEQQGRFKHKPYQEGYTKEDFGSWGMYKGKHCPFLFPRYVMHLTPKGKRNVRVYGIGSCIIDFKKGWTQ